MVRYLQFLENESILERFTRSTRLEKWNFPIFTDLFFKINEQTANDARPTYDSDKELQNSLSAFLSDVGNSKFCHYWTASWCYFPFFCWCIVYCLWDGVRQSGFSHLHKTSWNSVVSCKKAQNLKLCTMNPFCKN